MAIHVGQIGQKITLNVTATTTGASIRRIYYQKPDGSRGFWEADDESSTSISYTTVALSDIDQDGIWKFHAWVVTPNYSQPGEEVQVTVKPTVKAHIDDLI